MRTASSFIIATTAFGLMVLVPALAQAQSAGAGTSGSSAGSSPSAASPAPSGGSVSGRSAAGPETPKQAEAQRHSDKVQSICKGC